MFSAEALSFRQQSRLAISLSWVGGFTNVFAFLTFKTFASHMTGASTLLGMNTANGSWSGMILYGVLVLAFIFGAMSSAILLETARRRGVRAKYALPLTIEALLLTILVIVLRTSPDTTTLQMQCGSLGLIAYAMGLQNATITKISGAVVRSTHLTGVMTDFGIESVQFAIWAWDQIRGRRLERAGRVLRVSQRHPTLLRVALLASIWGSFVLGTVVGTLLYQRTREMALLGPIGFLVVVIIIQLKLPTADIRELDVLSDPELKLHGIMHSLLPPELGLYRVMHDRRHHFRAPSFSFWIDKLSPQKRAVILLLSPALQFNTTSLMNLQTAVGKLEESGRRLIIAGVTPAQYKKLAHEHLVERIGPENVCPDIEFAIALGVEMVRDIKG